MIRLDLDSGQLQSRALIEAAPAGINPIHHPDGWVGLSEGEGQDAARTWWIRSASQGRERLVAIDKDGVINHVADQEDGWLIPAASGTWLTATRRTISRWRLTDSATRGRRSGQP